MLRHKGAAMPAGAGSAHLPPSAGAAHKQRRVCCGTTTLPQLLLVIAVVVLLAGGHNIWVAHLIARCFRLAGRVAEGTKVGAVGWLTRSAGAGGLGQLIKGAPGGGRTLGDRGAEAGSGPGRPAAAGGAAASAEGAASGVEVEEELVITTLPPEQSMDAVEAAGRLLALLKPETRALLRAVDGDDGGGSPGGAASDAYAREFARALAKAVMAAVSVKDGAMLAGGVAFGNVSSSAAGGAAAAAAGGGGPGLDLSDPGRAGSAVTSADDASAASAAAAAAAAVNPAAALPYAWADERYHSHQTCYVQSDESELCVYDGVLCTDGINAFVAQDFASDLAADAAAAAKAGGGSEADPLAALAAVMAGDGTATSASPLLKQVLDAAVAEDAAVAAGGAWPAVDDSLAVASLQALLSSPPSSLTPAEALLAALVNATDPRRPAVWAPDPSSSCWDRRYNEPSAYEYSQCGTSPGTRREYAGDAPAPSVPEAELPDRGAWGTSFSAAGEAVRVGRHHPATDTSLPLGKRRWGPLNAGATFKVKELPPSAIWHAPVFDADADAGADADDDDAAEGGGEGASVGAAPAAAAAPLSTAPLAVLRRLLLRYATAGNAVRPGGGSAARPVEHPELPGLMLTRRTTVGGRQVDWADGPLWLVGLDTGKGHLTDPLAWLSKVGILYDAQRHNATGPWGSHPRDGFFHYLVRWQISAITSITPSPPTANTARFRGGSQWGPLPAQSYVVFGGPGGVEVASAGELPPLPRALLDIAVQDGARTFFSPLRHRYNFDNGRLLCAPRGAIVGTKPKFFTGRSDGWLFRQYGYMRSGQAAKGLQSHPKFSPRTLLYVDPPPGSGSPPLWNRAAVLAAIAATGLPYEVVPDILSLPFEQQVAKAAGAGVLIGPHSPSLAVGLFLPQHSAIIELTGAGVKHTTFRYLVNNLDLHHLPVHSYAFPPCDGTAAVSEGSGEDAKVAPDAVAAAVAAGKLLHAPPYYQRCTGRNVTSFEALLDHACATAHAAAPVVVPLEIFKRTLYDAIDTVGSFSLLHPEWADIANATGATSAVPPFGQIQWDQPFRKY